MSLNALNINVIVIVIGLCREVNPNAEDQTRGVYVLKEAQLCENTRTETKPTNKEPDKPGQELGNLNKL